MHRFTTPLSDFMTKIGKDFEIDQRSAQTLTISLNALPKAPTVIILNGV